MADNLPPSSANVTESGSLKLPEPSGPHRAVMAMLYLYLYYFCIKCSDKFFQIGLGGYVEGECVWVYKEIFVIKKYSIKMSSRFLGCVLYCFGAWGSVVVKALRC
jgi:hypothetical protein